MPCASRPPPPLTLRACPASSPPARRRRNPCSPRCVPHASVSSPCSSTHACVTSAALAMPSSPSCAPDPIRRPPRYAPSKYHWFPFFVWCISGSRSPLRFFVDDGASMMLASTIVPVFNRCCTLISSNNPIKPILQGGGSSGSSLVRQRTAQAQTRKAAHRRRADRPDRSSCRTG